MQATTPVRDPAYWVRPDIIAAGILPPSVWARRKLGLTFYGWQRDTLDAFGQRLPVSLAAANESGKTTYVVATAILWFLDTFGAAGGRVVLTSGSWLQVTSQLLPALRRFKPLFSDWQWLDTEIRMPGMQDPALIAFSTDNAGRAEGHHALDAVRAPLAYIIDESKSVKDGIFEAKGRCNPQFDMIVSSPGHPSGAFYRSHTSERSFFWTKRVRSADCPHLDPAIKERDIAKYGANSPYVLSKHEAQFTDDAFQVVLSPIDLANAIERPPLVSPGSTVAFCDFAAGGDENTLAIRRGNHAWLEAAWRERDTIQAVRRFIEILKRNGVLPSQTFGDESGLGHVMIDAFRDEGFPITGVNNGADAIDKEVYANRGSEIWYTAAREIVNGKVALQVDAETFRQMTTRRAIQAAKGKMAVEPKDDMAERGLTSPDRADALFGVISCGPHLLGAITTTAGISLKTPTFAHARMRTPYSR